MKIFEYLKKNKKLLFWIILLLLIFSIGYYLRAYIAIHKGLEGSPYEIFTSKYEYKLFSTGFGYHDYQAKSSRYPTSIILNSILRPIFGNIYLLYIFGAIVIFFLGKEISGKNLGGFLAFALYAVSSENLIQYTKTIGSSGLCYVLIWLSLLFLLRYLRGRKNADIVFFAISSVLALTSYHSGATAFIFYLFGIAISLAYSSKKVPTNKYVIEKKLLMVFIAIFFFYYLWIKIFDPGQLLLMQNSLFAAVSTIFKYPVLKVLLCFTAVAVFTLLIFLISRLKIIDSEYIPLLILIPSAVLIFSNIDFFGKLLSLGVKNYYSSSMTLNNYLAQALLTHVYVIILLPYLFKRDLSEKFILLRGWLIGLVLVFLALLTQKYYARIFDYSFPLMFVLFGLYWSKKRPFRIIVVTLTIAFLIISQLMIFHDPFTMRRYYNVDEMDSAKNVIGLGLDGVFASDLRTSALFSYLDKKDVLFGNSGEPLHDKLFYEYQNITDLNVNYVILSKYMKYIVYDANFETKPISDEVFGYYDSNFEKVYDDEVLKVYKITHNPIKSLGNSTI